MKRIKTEPVPGQPVERIRRGRNRELDSTAVSTHTSPLRDDNGIIQIPVEMSLTRDPRVPDLVYRMTKLGMTIMECARNLQVNVNTLENVVLTREDVRDAYDRGRWESLLLIEESLYRKAKGYEYEEVKEYSGVDSLGRPWRRRVKTIKRVEPDTTALIYYTKNRNPERWRDAWHVGVNGSYTQVNVTNTLNLDRLSQEDRELVARVAIAQIADIDGIATE